MRALDTSILVRLFLDDDAEQAAIARDILEGPVLLVPTVAMELGWVLRSRGGWPHSAIAEVITALVDLPQLVCRDALAVRWALQRYAAGADFADMLHLALSSEAQSFATFDKGISRHANDNVIPVEVF